MKFEWFVARRYFSSGRKGSSFLSFIKIMAIAGVAAGAAGLLIALAIVHGFKSNIEEKILGFGNHITIATHTTQPVYRADTLVTWLENIPEIEAAQYVIYGQGMVQRGDRVDGTFVKGVAEEGDLSDLRSYISYGRYDLSVQESGRPGIVMGRRLARTLGADIGSTITVYTVRGMPAPDNFPEIMQFELTGIYHTGIDKFDDTQIYIDRIHAARLFDITYPMADQVDVRVHDLSRINEVQTLLFDKLRFPYYNQTIYQEYSGIFAWINLQEQIIPLVIGIMILIAAFNLIGAVLMMVLERTKDIGILKAMGAVDKKIRSVFLYEGVFVGAIGLIIATVILLLFAWIQGTYELIPLSEENYFMSTVPVEPRLVHYLIVVAVTMILCTLASWLPARVAAKTDPLRIIQFGR